MKNKNDFDDLDPGEMNLAKIPKEENGKMSGGLKEILSMFFCMIFIVMAACLLYTYIVQQVEVVGSSMETTLNNKDHLILEKLSYRFRAPKRFDIIVFRPYEQEKNTYYIKRVIGLPGERVQIKEGYIYINGMLLEEGYGNGLIQDQGLVENVVKLKEEEYFVLGDNRNNSKDSRYEEIGNVTKGQIVGRALLRIWPINHFEILRH